MSGKTVDTTSKGLWLQGSGQFGKLMQAVAIVTTVSFGISFISSGNRAAIAADPLPAAPTPDNQTPTLSPDSQPLDLKALKPGNTPTYVVTANSISLTQLTIPSLWWLREQIADEAAYGSNLLENWLAYPGGGNSVGRVDLVVNRQSWSLLDYLDRYAFIHTFGKAARDYGYNVRVFDGQATLLGASTCDFSTIRIDALQDQQTERSSLLDSPPSMNESALPPNPVDSIACSILLDSSGKAGLRGGSNQLPGAGAAKALDTRQR
ncbi:MAG: hypothetical protein KME42_14340 [Tildeniella nuda ZEHNDER 1965/U140]|jgi:hypothetical protein|nr:hypothetical protein [Tildeniella nuda ZEHNDER 1965/U140]